MALEPPHLDPSAGAAGAIDEIVYNNLFEGLVTLDKQANYNPYLQKNGKFLRIKKPIFLNYRRMFFFTTLRTLRLLN